VSNDTYSQLISLLTAILWESGSWKVKGVLSYSCNFTFTLNSFCTPCSTSGLLLSQFHLYYSIIYYGFQRICLIKSERGMTPFVRNQLKKWPNFWNFHSPTQFELYFNIVISAAQPFRVPCWRWLHQWRPSDLALNPTPHVGRDQANVWPSFPWFILMHLMSKHNRHHESHLRITVVCLCRVLELAIPHPPCWWWLRCRRAQLSGSHCITSQGSELLEIYNAM